MIVFYYIIAIMIIVEAVFFVPFVLSCTFKKSCKWKGCPFRCKDQGITQMRICEKCPYPFDDAEAAEINETADKMEKLIETLAHKKEEL